MTASGGRRLAYRAVIALVAGVIAQNQGVALAGETASVSLDGGVDALALGKGRLQFTVNDDAKAFGKSALADRRRSRFRVDGEASYGNLVRLRLQGDYADLWQSGDDSSMTGFAFTTGAAGHWQENTVSETTFNLGLLDDRLRLISHRAWSRYTASAAHLDSLKGDDRKDGERFLNNPAAEGAATLHRLDVEVWRARQTGLAFFAQYSEVDTFFKSVEVSRTNRRGASVDRKDPFATPNQQTMRLGTNIRAGPMHLILHRDTSRKLDSADGDKTLRHTASLWVDLDDVRSRAGEVFQGGVWAGVPASVWVSLADGRVQGSGVSADPDDTTADLSFGSSWHWNSSYASASFWRSVYDSRGAWVDDYDWRGQGANLSFGLYGQAWSADTSFSVQRSDDLAPATRSVRHGYDGSLSLTFRPDSLPDFSTTLGLGRYETDYRMHHLRTRGDSWGVRVTSDLSKYLSRPKDSYRPRLKLYYGFEGSRWRDGVGERRVTADHTIAALLQLRL